MDYKKLQEINSLSSQIVVVQRFLEILKNGDFQKHVESICNRGTITIPKEIIHCFVTKVNDYVKDEFKNLQEKFDKM